VEVTGFFGEPFGIRALAIERLTFSSRCSYFLQCDRPWNFDLAAKTIGRRFAGRMRVRTRTRSSRVTRGFGARRNRNSDFVMGSLLVMCMLVMSTFVMSTLVGCAPALTATPQPATASGMGGRGFATFFEAPVASFAAGRGAMAPKATAGKAEDDEAIHFGGYIGGSFGLSETVDGEVFGLITGPLPSGGGIGVRAQLISHQAWDVGVAVRAGGLIGTGGNAVDSASEFDGLIPQPLAKVGFGQATITANRASGSFVPLASLSVLPTYIVRVVDGEPGGPRPTTTERYIGVVTTATVVLYYATSTDPKHRFLIGPMAALAMFAMPERDGGVGWVPSFGIAAAITP
jgi:hypothetical protein